MDGALLLQILGGAASLAVVIAGGIVVGNRRLEDQRLKLEAALSARVGLLERERDDLLRRVATLESERVADVARIARLEEDLRLERMVTARLRNQGDKT